MVFDQSVIGIASKSMFGTSNYVNLLGKSAVKFLKKASQSGWDISFSED